MVGASGDLISGGRAVMAAADDAATAQRRAAAQHAVTWVRDGMVIGLGSGRAASHAMEALAVRVRAEGLHVRGIASSARTEAKARELGLSLVSLEAHPELDLTMDGADEVDPQLYLLKGGGGALLREKVLAGVSASVVIVVEAAKLVPRLGTTRGVPLEVLPFAWRACLPALARLGGRPALRRMPDGAPALTDNRHYLVDCDFPPEAFADPEALDHALHAIPGMLETGLFWRFRERTTVVVGEATGVRVLGRPLP